MNTVTISVSSLVWLLIIVFVVGGLIGWGLGWAAKTFSAVGEGVCFNKHHEGNDLPESMK